MSAYAIELLGILIALGLLIFLAFRGFTLLLAAPVAAIVAAAFSGEPVLAKWTLTFMGGTMGGTGRFIINFFPLFLLGGVFGRLMDDGGAALSLARDVTGRLGVTREIIAVVLACAVLTYGGVSLFVVAFAVFPVAAALFRQAAVPHRLIPPAIALGAFTFTMTALPGTRQFRTLSRWRIRHHAICRANSRYPHIGDHSGFWPMLASYSQKLVTA